MGAPGYERRFELTLHPNGSSNRCTRREQILAQNAFYMGARMTLKLLNHMIEIGESDEALKTIQRHARTINTLQGMKPRARRH